MPVNAMDQKNQIAPARKYYDGKLHRLLCDRIPEFVSGGRIDTGRLHVATGNARYTCYRWMIEDRVSPAAAKSLMEISKGRITRIDILPFVLA